MDALPADAQVLARCRGWDCGGTEGGGDPTAGVRLARTRDGLIYVEHVVRGHWGPQAFEGPRGILRQTADLDGRPIRIREEQEPGSAGKKVIASHAQLLVGFDYQGEPATGDKVTRARPFAAQAAVGNVRLVRGAWNRDYLDELATFPNGRHDDQVDASATAFNTVALQPHESEPQQIVVKSGTNPAVKVAMHDAKDPNQYPSSVDPVATRSDHAGVPQPAPHGIEIHTGLQQVQCGRVTNGMGVNPLRALRENRYRRTTS